MTNPHIAANDQRINDAITNGQRLHLGVTLSFCGGSSDKFWTAVWAEDKIAINFGRHGASKGRVQMQNHHDTNTPAKAAKKLWSLLRDKVGKGYTVVDAAIMIVPPLHQNSPLWSSGNMITAWDHIRDARRMNPRRPLDHPELLGRSQRTPTEGAQVLLSITSPDADLETLIASAVADPSERFLPPIVMSRPDVPEEAKFLAALSGTAKVIM